ncbi:Hypothetical protein GLP15_1427 [Giardia lamblia P15]|uniref:Uncharacterized protein n=1 Tax=Giardia intestinalis (strain P15) TaxID=658858 RepID=E1F4U0_GIAIA|nr:Hypothetical protein GLP15_1427 [Giardia lamblia P15]
MNSNIPASGWMRFGANILTIWIFILCYILVLKRRSGSLLASKMRTLIHIYYLFSILSQALFTRTSIIGYFVNKWLQNNATASAVWGQVSQALYTATNRVVPSLMVTIVIVSAIDGLRNTTLCQKAMVVTTIIYTIIVTVVSMGAVFCEDLCTDRPEVRQGILYAQEALTSVPYIVSIGMILILFRKSQEVAETDFARALIEDDRIDDAATDMNNRKRQLTTIFILRTMAMVILFSWNITWISLFFNATEPSWVPYVEAVLLVIYETLNAAVFIQRGK